LRQLTGRELAVRERDFRFRHARSISARIACVKSQLALLQLPFFQRWRSRA
jgi:hypothetical protein